MVVAAGTKPLEAGPRTGIPIAKASHRTSHMQGAEKQLPPLNEGSRKATQHREAWRIGAVLSSAHTLSFKIHIRVVIFPFYLYDCYYLIH